MTKASKTLKKFQDIQPEFDAEFIISKNYQLTKAAAKKVDESEGTWVIEGFSSTGDLDTQDSIITEKAIQEGANSLQKYNTLLFNHDANRPLGKILVAEARKDKLFVKCSISKSEPDIWEKVKDGTLSKFSIMGRILDYDTEESDDREIVIIKSLQLFEVSLVSVPANVEAKMLNWYIEKSFKSILSSKNTKKDYAENESEEDAEEKPSTVDNENLIESVDDALGLMETIVANLSGSDRDAAVRLIQWLQAMKTKKSPENATNISESVNISEELNVPKNSRAEKDYVDVLPDGDEAELVTKSVDATQELQKAADLQNDDADEKKADVKIVETKIEKKADEKEVVQATVKEEDSTVDVAKSFAGVVNEIKELAKSTLGAVNAVQEQKNAVDAVKKEIDASLNEIKEILKGIPVRQTKVVDSSEADDREDAGYAEKARKRVKNFDKLPPEERLRHVLEEQLAGK